MHANEKTWASESERGEARGCGGGVIFISVPKPLPVPSQVVLNCSPVFSRFYARAQRSNENKRKRGLCILVPRGCAPVSYHQESRPTFSSPEPTILLACSRNRDLWEQPFQACAVDADCVKFGYFHCYFKIVAPSWTESSLQPLQDTSQAAKACSFIKQYSVRYLLKLYATICSIFPLSRPAAEKETSYSGPLWVRHEMLRLKNAWREQVKSTCIKLQLFLKGATTCFASLEKCIPLELF